MGRKCVNRFLRAWRSIKTMKHSIVTSQSHRVRHVSWHAHWCIIIDRWDVFLEVLFKFKFKMLECVRKVTLQLSYHKILPQLWRSFCFIKYVININCTSIILEDCGCFYKNIESLCTWIKVDSSMRVMVSLYWVSSDLAVYIPFSVFWQFLKNAVYLGYFWEISSKSAIKWGSIKMQVHSLHYYLIDHVHFMKVIHLYKYVWYHMWYRLTLKLRM